MSNAPHLPPKSERPPKNFKEFLLFLAMTVVVAFFAGIAASTVAFTYLFPETPASRPVLTFFQNKPSSDASKNTLSEEEKQSAQEKMVTIIDSRKKIGEMYDASAKIGIATFFTLDGWAVLAPVNIVPTDISFLEAIDSQGRILKIKKVIKDEETGFVFLQVDGNGFSVFSFGSANSSLQNFVWVYDGKDFVEQKISVQYPRTKETAKNILQQGIRLSIVSGVPEIILSEKGELFGFADKNGNVFSGSEFNTKLRFFQKNGILSKTIFAVGGYVIEGVKKDERGVVVHTTAFVITELSRGGKTELQGGDVILQVAGKEFSPQTIREEIASAGNDVIFRVLRREKEIDIMVKK